MVMMHIHVNTKLHFSRFRTVCKRIVGQNTVFEENEITSGVVNGFTNDLERFLGLPWLNLYVVVSIETEPAMFVYVMAICKNKGIYVNNQVNKHNCLSKVCKRKRTGTCKHRMNPNKKKKSTKSLLVWLEGITCESP